MSFRDEHGDAVTPTTLPIETILEHSPTDASLVLGHSREGRPLLGERIAPLEINSKTRRVSLLGGCHADEPVGPLLLARLLTTLRQLDPNHPLRQQIDWWIVPHINPDGAERNRSWSQDPESLTPERALTNGYDWGDYLAAVVRELPGDDIEFGFPRDPHDTGARPENRAIAKWWRSAGAPFHLHVTLHGMAFAAGPWFLIEPAWAARGDGLGDGLGNGRINELKRRCTHAVAELGYTLHDVERHGEKGFYRIERGFCTRPDSRAMQQFFLERGDAATAALFRPSSMEFHRSLGGDALTLVSEMPLFLLPGVGESLGPPDRVAQRWQERIQTWRQRIAQGEALPMIREEAAQAGLVAMPLRDQFQLQWTLITAGLAQLGEARDGGEPHTG